MKNTMSSQKKSSTMKNQRTMVNNVNFNQGGNLTATIAAPKSIGSKALSKIATKAVQNNLKKSRQAEEGVQISIPSRGTMGAQMMFGQTLNFGMGGGGTLGPQRGQTFGYQGTIAHTIAECDMNPTRQEETLLNLINMKDLNGLLYMLIEYKKCARPGFWQKFRFNGILALHNISRHLDPPYRSLIIGVLCGGEYYDADLIKVSILRGDLKTTLLVSFIYKYVKKRMPNSAFRNLHCGSMTDFIKNWKHESAPLVSVINTTKRPQNESVTDAELREDAIHLFKTIETQKPEELMDYLLFSSKIKLRKVSVRFYEMFGVTISDHTRSHNFKPHFQFFIQILISTSVNLLYSISNLIHESTMMDEIETIFPYLLTVGVKIDCKNLKRVYNEMTGDGLSELVQQRFKPPVSTYFLSLLG